MKDLVTVRKDNQMIQNNRFTLSLQEQRIMLFLISKIKPWDSELEEYEFSVTEFSSMCGLDEYQSGRTYAEIKAIIKGLRDKSMWIETEPGVETAVSWIAKARMDKRHQAIKIKLDDDLRPYLLELKSCYTEYELIYALNFKSKYTVRLYEVAKSIHGKKLGTTEIKYNLSDFRKLLGVQQDDYPLFANLRQRVLEPALREVNESSDINLLLTPLKSGRKVTAIDILIADKPPEEMLEIHSRLTEARDRT